MANFGKKMLVVVIVTIALLPLVRCFYLDNKFEEVNSLDRAERYSTENTANVYDQYLRDMRMFHPPVSSLSPVLAKRGKPVVQHMLAHHSNSQDAEEGRYIAMVLQDMRALKSYDVCLDPVTFDRFVSLAGQADPDDVAFGSESASRLCGKSG